MVNILVADGDAAAVWIVPSGTVGKFRYSISPAEVLVFGGFSEEEGVGNVFIVTDATCEDVQRCTTTADDER